jgi:hypothetical protein
MNSIFGFGPLFTVGPLVLVGIVMWITTPKPPPSRRD